MNLDELEALLKTTEPLSPIDLEQEAGIEFTLPAGWNAGIKAMEGTDLTDAVMNFGGVEYKLTKDAILQATSAIGITKEYASKTPGPMIAEHLNYWYGHEESNLRLYAVGEKGLALVKGQTNPISNVALLGTISDVLKDEQGPFGSELLSAPDPVVHDLRLTQFRVVIEGSESKLIDTDTWHVGVDLQNSLTAESPLQMRGYLHVDQDVKSGITVPTGTVFSRKGNPSTADAQEWVEATTNNILEHLPHVLSEIEALTKIDIEGEVNHTLIDIFERYKMPAPARPLVMAEIVEKEDLTMYGVMTAVASTARNAELSPVHARRLREIAGDLPMSSAGRCGSCHRLPIT